MAVRWSAARTPRRRLLADVPDDSLWCGDMLRLPHHPLVGPQSPPLDLLIYDLWGYDNRLGLMILKGYKAGMPLFYAPPESQGQDRLSLETSWLHANWDTWFVYNYHSDENGNPIPMAMDGTMIIRMSQPAPRLSV